MSPSWPVLDFEALAPTVDHLHRLVQIGGKYTIDSPFEPNWGNVMLTVTPRGVTTPTLHAGDVAFSVAYDLLDDSVELVASTGREVLPLGPGSVAAFLARFTEAAARLGIPALENLSQPEIVGAPPLDEDTLERPYDPGAAQLVSAALGHAAAALTAYQAPFRGHRHRVGMMWGGFDLSAQRFNGRSVVPPDSHPVFLQNGMTDEVVSVGFWLGTADAPAAGFYAYVHPVPDGMADADLGAPGAQWNADAGIAFLPWAALLDREEPTADVVAFGDAVYALAGWPAALTGSRIHGREATRNPIAVPTHED